MPNASAYSGDASGRAAIQAASGSAAAVAMVAAMNARRHILGWYTVSRMATGCRDTTPLLAVALISATLLMTELALTRIFSVVMYYHFAFLAISIALFGLSASGVFRCVVRQRLERQPSEWLLARHAVVYAVCTTLALFFLVRLRVGLTYSPRNLGLMIAIYLLAALPFFTGGLVITLAISRFSSQITAVYAADLVGAAIGCLLLIPLLDSVGAPGVVLGASGLALGAAVLFAPSSSRTSIATASVLIL